MSCRIMVLKQYSFIDNFIGISYMDCIFMDKTWSRIDAYYIMRIQGVYVHRRGSRMEQIQVIFKTIRHNLLVHLDFVDNSVWNHSAHHSVHKLTTSRQKNASAKQNLGVYIKFSANILFSRLVVKHPPAQADFKTSHTILQTSSRVKHLPWEVSMSKEAFLKTAN